MDMKKKSKGFTFLILSLVLVTVAVFGGFALAKAIRSNPETGTGPKQQAPADNENRPSQGGSKAGVVLTNPIEVIYDVDFETGRIEQILISILNTYSSKLDFIRIDTNVMYTMSASLYSALTPENTTLPQTVTFSELYRYYGNDHAFDAGRRIIGELLSVNTDYYCALPERDFDRVFSIRSWDDETVIRFAADGSQVKEDYGTEGSVRGFIGDILENAVTNCSIESRNGYVELFDSLEDSDISFTDAPVYENNESCWLDTGAMAGILYEILY